jgi:hypothetical protein
VILLIALWAHQTTYKVITQYTPSELVYGIQLIMFENFIVPTQRIQNVFENDINEVFQVRMKDLIKLDEDHWQARKNMMIKDN